ncbi:MAG: hypothetical protein ABSF33_09990 [Acidimicrobiales bacterium]|jgi:hypothetical protein
MTISAVHPESVDQRHGRPADGSADEEGEGSKRICPEAHPDRVARVRPSGVWFGPKHSESEERKLIAYLGSHNGVAVLQWPRDAERAGRFLEFGIPCLWFVQDVADHPPVRSEFEAWLPRSASDIEIHACLETLCRWAATQRSEVPLELNDDGWLHLGEHGVHLTQPESGLAAVLVAHFGEAVDDTLLAVTTGRTETLAGELHHLDEDVNALGLEVIPVTDHTHQIRRCRA